MIPVLIVLEYGIEQAVVGTRLKKDEDGVGDEEKDRNGTRDTEDGVVNLAFNKVRDSGR